jgi:hypothetical protein
MQPEEENLRLRAVTDLPLDEENASVCHPPKNLRLALRAPNNTEVNALVWHGQTSCSPCSVGGD